MPRSTAQVVLLRGVNVGGHRRFRPSTLAQQLKHLDAVSIGAAGTLVIRRPIGRAALREELATRLPFASAIAICDARAVMQLRDGDFFAAEPIRPGMVRFVSVLTAAPRVAPSLPLQMPVSGPWLVKILARDGRFVVGVYRRHMRVIGYLGALDRLFGVPATTRSWTTLDAIGRALGE